MNESRNSIVILEDNLDRLEAMRGIIESLAKNFKVRHFDDVGAMRSHAPIVFNHTRLISLDYCLDGSRSSAPSPGNGMDAVRFLIERDPVCPVIVHTSLSGESRRMADALAGRGWTVKQVNFGSRDRVEKWRAAVTELLNGKA